MTPTTDPTDRTVTILGRAISADLTRMTDAHDRLTIEFESADTSLPIFAFRAVKRGDKARLDALTVAMTGAPYTGTTAIPETAPMIALQCRMHRFVQANGWIVVEATRG